MEVATRERNEIVVPGLYFFNHLSPSQALDGRKGDRNLILHISITKIPHTRIHTYPWVAFWRLVWITFCYFLLLYWASPSGTVVISHVQAHKTGWA